MIDESLMLDVEIMEKEHALSMAAMEKAINAMESANEALKCSNEALRLAVSVLSGKNVSLKSGTKN